MLKLFINLQLTMARLFDDEEGQGLTEYALILALIAIIAIAALSLLGGKVTKALSTVGTALPSDFGCNPVRLVATGSVPYRSRPVAR